MDTHGRIKILKLDFRKMSCIKTLFITGTGTETGKTLVVAGIAFLCGENGLNTAVMKPVQTGVKNRAGDISFIKSLVPGIYPLSDKLACPYSFALAASPHLAAKNEGKNINISVIQKAYDKALQSPSLDVLLLEGAGGLYVPINEDDTMIDLIKKLGIAVILVSPAGLGMINHTLLSVEALKTRNIKIAGIVVNRMPDPPGIIEKDNIKTIEKLSGAPILAVIREIKAQEPVRFKTALQNEFKHPDSSRKMLDLLQNNDLLSH